MMTIRSLSLKGRGMLLSVGAEMAKKLNTCMKNSVTVGTRDDSRFQGPQNPVFPVQPVPFSISSLSNLSWLAKVQTGLSCLKLHAPMMLD